MDDDFSKWISTYPEKFAGEKHIFDTIGTGDRLFIGTGCGEPRYLLSALIAYVESDPKAFADTEVFQAGTSGGTLSAEERFAYNFRCNSFFINEKSRGIVNSGLGDYTPVFLSRVPAMFRRKQLRFDVALIQTSLPDKNGYVSLGISVDICKAAIEHSRCVVAQLNASMPRTHGDSFINIRSVDFLIRHDEPLLEYRPSVPSDIAWQIGKYVSRIVNDGDTIQVGYGSLPNAVLGNLKGKKHLGIHTEFMTDAVVELIALGVIDNSMKSIDRGKTVVSFCMGTEKTYRHIDDNPEMEFRTIDYTNDPLVISRHRNMTAINSALQIDLTGQASVESFDCTFYSGIGGTADFMRSAPLAPGGKTVLTIESTAKDGEISRIVPVLENGTGVTFNRGDVFYVATEFGIAYIHGKSIRERAMDLVAIAHPKFRAWLIEEARRLNIIYRDQAFIPDSSEQYPEHLEENRRTKSGVRLLFRPVRINDENRIKEFFYSLSDQSMHRRFMTFRTDMPHDLRQHFVIIDYSKEIVILATTTLEERETVVGIGQYSREEESNYAEIAVAVRDDFQNRGIGTELVAYCAMLAGKKGLEGFIAEVLEENQPMLRVFEKMGFEIRRELDEGVYRLRMKFQ